ncbi:helix-turn-helix transcriptional regulator [Elizabethkingia anophelis]|nr:helix-turn-helix transcriptional regulator [Elizabethkingia anophelis]MCT4100022.1 helix-turn-helix transcriptional regulator [Elizabethkingia anophelis]MCT4164444.1 helix-turn-helix transcriptional regulator [Elizabethkingia anophelis]MDV3592590.1 transcriptional regulator [Elizabethkingia anophelis]HAY3538550.1 helix-turn-helix transcriptional regulator [Elizabethkingia anophelis]
MKQDKIEIQPVMDALEVIGGKWKFPILYTLCSGKKRFKDLLEDIGKITPKMLSLELKDLEINGLVTRTAIATVPVTVEYEMTEYGQTLKPVLMHIQDWGKKHREKIIKESSKSKS